MDVSVAIDGRKSRLRLQKGATIADAIASCGANAQTVLVKLNGAVAHERTQLEQGDRVELAGIICSG
jgi:sulfur carrier protein ThiS